MERVELGQILRLWADQGRGTRDQGPGPRLISEPDPLKFMAAFADAVAGDSDVFLCDPNWGETERAQVVALTGLASPKLPRSAGGWLMIPTGGSSGKLKFARHDQDTITVAVQGFTRHFGLPCVNAVGMLPLHHVGGFMAWMRCALTGGEYRPLDWKAVEQGAVPELPAKLDGWVISLVPTQLERLLRQPAATAWLAKFRIVFLGGAPAGGDLMDRAAAARIPLSPGYGMTETAAMVTALRPEEFLAGARSSGDALPQVKVAISGDGMITVAGDSLFRGYYPEWRNEGAFETADLGRIDEQRRLHVLGRGDEVIITGGEKVNPAEVEAVLRGSGGLPDVVVIGVPDTEWGQVVVAAYPGVAWPDVAKLKEAASGLSTHKRPKHFLPLESWPVTSAGKVNRPEVARLVRSGLRNNTKQESS